MDLKDLKLLQGDLALLVFTSFIATYLLIILFKTYNAKKNKTLNNRMAPEHAEATCAVCKHSDLVVNFEIDYEQDGWEMPEYKILVCPKCDDGGDVCI